MTGLGIITQARMTSTRLPGKVLLTANGATMLSHHLRRLGETQLPIVVATTSNTADDAIVEASEAFGASVFRGSEHDVLSRFAGAAAQFGFEGVVRVTSDCPLIDPVLINEGVAAFVEEGSESVYVSNTAERSYPRGFDYEIFSARALFDAAENASEAFEREHVTPYLYRNGSSGLRVRSIRRPVDASDLRLTLDEEADYTLLRRLIEEHGADRMSSDDIVALLRAHPELAGINAHVEQKKLGQ